MNLDSVLMPALARRRHHPRASLFPVIALAFLFLDAAVGSFLHLWLNLQPGGGNMAPAQAGILLGLLEMMQGAIALVAWRFLLAAINLVFLIQVVAAGPLETVAILLAALPLLLRWPVLGTATR